MTFNLVFCVILSLSVVYGGVSFRPIRSPQWQAPVRPYNGSNTWGGSNYPGPAPSQWQAPPARPYNGSNTWGGPRDASFSPSPWQAPVRPNNTANIYRPSNTSTRYVPQVPRYNNTRPVGSPTTRVPYHLPGNRPYPSYNLTQQPNQYQPSYNQSRPSVSGGIYSTPQQPYQSRFDSQYNATRGTGTQQLYPDLSNRFGGGGTPNYGSNVNPAPVNPYPGYGSGGGSPNPNIQYGGGGLPNTSPPYGGGVLPNTNPTYGNYNTTRTNLPTFIPNARYNNTSPFGGQHSVEGANTWGHPNYQAPNVTRQPLPPYYNPRVYS